MNEIPKSSNSRSTGVLARLGGRLWDRLLVRALVMQAVAGVGVFAAAYTLVVGTGVAVPPFAVVAGQGLVAAVLGLKWGLDRWWIPIQLALPPALFASLALPIPSWIYGAVFFILLLVFWNATGDRVPLYLTNRRTWAVLAEQIPAARPKTSFIDIGCGASAGCWPTWHGGGRRPAGAVSSRLPSLTPSHGSASIYSAPVRSICATGICGVKTWRPSMSFIVSCRRRRCRPCSKRRAGKCGREACSSAIHSSFRVIRPTRSSRWTTVAEPASTSGTWANPSMTPSMALPGRRRPLET